MSTLAIYWLVAATVLTVQPVSYEKTPETPDVCISAGELQLYELITKYRAKKRLPKIPLSASLSYVAKQHCIDLVTNGPQKSKCNPHSWSDSEKWTGCCYTSNHKNPNCMWDKPREMTSYPAHGFEIITMMYLSSDTEYQIQPSQALDNWKNSAAHHDVILNRSIWKSNQWNAVGIGIYKGYAIAWFGMERDPAGEPVECN